MPTTAGTTGSQKLKIRYVNTASTAAASGTPVYESANGSSASTAPAPPRGSVRRVSAYPVA
jgi:hypothetical protein